MKKVQIGIIGAMQIEVEALHNIMENTAEYTISGITFVTGILYGKSLVVAKSGVGKVFAAICSEAMILNFSPDVIINTGVAGALSPALKIGDITIAESVVQHDMDTSHVGDPVGLISGINVINIYSDAKVTQRLINAVDQLGINCVTGVIASGDQFINEEARKLWIADYFKAVSCEMEGAGIGQVCYVNNVPFGVVRSISDSADDASQMDYPEFCKLAAKNSTEVIKVFVKDYE